MDGDALILLHPKGGISVPAAAGLRSQHQSPLQTTTLQTTSLPPLRSASMPKQKLFDDKLSVLGALLWAWGSHTSGRVDFHGGM